MPTPSKASFRFMQAVKNNPDFAKRAGVPQSVGREMIDANQRAGVTYNSLPGRVDSHGRSQHLNSQGRRNRE
jgi:hypothetical protein